MSNQQDQNQQKEKEMREWAKFLNQDDGLPPMTGDDLENVYNALQQDMTINHVENSMPAPGITNTSAHHPTYGLQPEPHNLPSQQLNQMHAPHDTYFWAPTMQEPPGTTPAGHYENTGFYLAPQNPLNDNAVWAPEFQYTAFNPNHTQVAVVGQTQNTGFYTRPHDRFAKGAAFLPAMATTAVQQNQMLTSVSTPRVLAEPPRWFPPAAQPAEDLDTEMQDEANGENDQDAEHDEVTEQLPQEYEFFDHIPEEWDREEQDQRARDAATQDTEGQMPSQDEVQDNPAPPPTRPIQLDTPADGEAFGNEDPVNGLTAKRTTQLAKFGRKRRASSSASEEEYYIWKDKVYLIQGNEPEEWLKDRFPSKKRKVDPMLAESSPPPPPADDGADWEDGEDASEPDSPLSEPPESPSPPPAMMEALAPTFIVQGEPDNIIAVAEGDAPVVPYEILEAASSEESGHYEDEDSNDYDEDAMDIDE